MPDTSAPHSITFRLDAGIAHHWSVTCPGRDVGRCQLYEPSGEPCRCPCPDCTLGDHYGCSEHDSYAPTVGPGCQIHPIEVCGLQDWLDAAGAEIVDGGKVTFQAAAVLVWDYDDPTIRIVGTRAAVYPAGGDER